MNMVPVTSTNISSIGYENDTLYVSFNSGGLYAYSNVPISVYEALIGTSHGSYLASHIKGYYPYKKLR